MRNNLIFFTIIIAMLLLVGCSNTQPTKPIESNSNNSDNEYYITTETSEVFNNAKQIIDDLPNKNIVKDFWDIYNTMTNLSQEQDKFVEQLRGVQKLCEKNGTSLNKGDYYLLNPNTISITPTDIKKYITDSAYHDILSIANDMLYPVLLEKYGDSVNGVKNLTKQDFLVTDDTFFDTLVKSDTDYNVIKEEYNNPYSKNMGSIKFEYFPNKRLQAISMPIIISDDYLSDDEFMAFYDMDIQSQKEIAKQRFQDMINAFDLFLLSREYLSLIYTADEMLVIENYIKSLTPEYIWENNMVKLETVDYSASALSVRYKETYIVISFNLNRVSLRIIGANEVNAFTSAYYTVLAGLVGEHHEFYAAENMQTYINYTPDFEPTITEWSFDLDKHEGEYQSKADKTYPLYLGQQFCDRESNRVVEIVTMDSQTGKQFKCEIVENNNYLCEFWFSEESVVDGIYHYTIDYADGMVEYNSNTNVFTIKSSSISGSGTYLENTN